jgi:AAA family ATP:ADP antiporter
MFPYGIIKPVRDAQYLLELGSINLPFAYLSTAVIMGFFIHFYSKLQVKIKRRVLIISSLIFFAVTCSVSRQFFMEELDWMPLAFWIWANIFIVVLVAQFWILVNDVFNPREVKRLIGFFGSGGLLGGILGGLLTASSHSFWNSYPQYFCRKLHIHLAEKKCTEH